MTLPGKYRFLPLAFMLVFSAWASAFAQKIPVVFEGKVHSLGVIEEKGTSYVWKIFTDELLSKEAKTTEVEYVNGHESATIAVLWKKQGIYFFSVSVFGPTGCMNIKIGMIKVVPVEIEAIIAGATFSGACQLVKLDGSKSIGDSLKYEWSMVDPGGVLSQSTGAITEFSLSPSYIGSLPADFRVKLQVTDLKGHTNSSIVTIKVDLLPVAEVNSSGKLEKDGSLIVDGTASTGTALNYLWFTTEGRIIGANDLPTAHLAGAGIYTLEITDNHGCKSVKIFKFPLEIHYIMANPDYARTSWALDTTIIVLNNDRSTANLIPNTVRVTKQPERGGTKVNSDGTITYMPTGKSPGRDQFIYEVCDAANLCTSATVTIDIYDSGITAPEGFSPNGDGENDHLVFSGLENYLKSQLCVFTRSGQLVYKSDDYQNDWDGSTIRSSLTSLKLVPTGVYYYILKLGGTNRTLKGFVYIGY